MKVAYVSTYPPEACGVGIYTRDLRAAVAPGAGDVVALASRSVSTRPREVAVEFDGKSLNECRRIARWISESDSDIVSLQHEPSLYGGRHGRFVLDLVERIDKPLVATLHTVKARPSRLLRWVIADLGRMSNRVVVPSVRAVPILTGVYGIPERKIQWIPHGADSKAPALDRTAYDGLLGRGPLILTFGLLHASKGIEFMIDAMQEVVARCPGATYLVLGATHPRLVLREGEAYRRSLEARVGRLGLGDSVRFIDRFAEESEIDALLAACDVYVTPYLSMDQASSGTLARAVAHGKAVVSTSYPHACDLLAEGRGRLVPFRDARALSREVSELLLNQTARREIEHRAAESARGWTWERVGAHHVALFEQVRAERRGPERCRLRWRAVRVAARLRREVRQWVRE